MLTLPANIPYVTTNRVFNLKYPFRMVVRCVKTHSNTRLLRTQLENLISFIKSPTRMVVNKHTKKYEAYVYCMHESDVMWLVENVKEPNIIDICHGPVSNETVQYAIANTNKRIGLFHGKYSIRVAFNCSVNSPVILSINNQFGTEATDDFRFTTLKAQRWPYRDVRGVIYLNNEDDLMLVKMLLSQQNVHVKRAILPYNNNKEIENEPNTLSQTSRTQDYHPGG